MSDDPHDQPYRPEDFVNVQNKPFTLMQRAVRKLIGVGIVTILIILFAVVREVIGS